MPDYCSCGAELPQDALFCHKCGKPQRYIQPVEPAEPAAEVAPPAPPAAAAPQPLPLNFHNPIAVRIAFIVALVTALLSWLPLLNIVLWTAAGFIAVFLYRRRTGYLLTVRAGMQMGWITGIIFYLITQGRGMAERNAQQAQQARDELRRVVGFSVADEITKLDQLKKSGSITDVEYGRLRAKLVS